MKTFSVYAGIALGGAVGAMARHLVGMMCLHLLGARFPVGTFVINITGSFFLGWFITMTGEKMQVSEVARIAVATGFVGAYTTFSTYMFESNALLTSGNTMKGIVNMVGSVVVGLLAVKLGIWVAQRA
ncbi:MAG TPA: fluoride efflux transporter CrcB [Tepidisphaeraceae bacterium]|jgi:CrcB protein